jgi:hypothetical protein
MESNDTRLQPWSITKAEWDGYETARRAFGPLNLVGTVFGVLCGIVLIWMPTILGRMANSPPPDQITWAFRGIGISFIMLMLALDVWQRIARRRWEAIHPLVWTSNGCVCPWCKVRVDEEPCPRHGFTLEDQPKLIAYWESLPTKGYANMFRALAALRRTARRRPVTWAILSGFQRAYLASAISANDADTAPLTRLRASMPWISIKITLGAITLALAFWLLPRSFTLGALSGCWPYLLIGPYFVLVGPLVRTGRLRCSACGQLCSSTQPTLCPECGADLTKPAAVRRHQYSYAKLPLLVIPFVLAFALVMFQDRLISVLPAPLRNTFWTNFRPPNGYWQSLNPASMSQAEVDEASQLLITCAEPGRSRPLFDFSFLDKARMAGKLSDAMLESAARAVVQATLEIDQINGRVSASIHPSFGELILPKNMTPRLVFGGVSIDDGPWSPPADWSLFLHDTEIFWRTAGQLPALPEDKLVFRVDLGELPAGCHTIRARCSIVLYEQTWVRYRPAFDDTGALVPPRGATWFELPLEATVTVPKSARSPHS